MKPWKKSQAKRKWSVQGMMNHAYNHRKNELSIGKQIWHWVKNPRAISTNDQMDRYIYIYNTTIHPSIDINKHNLTSSNLITQQPSEHMSINQKEMQPTSKEGCFVIFNYLGSEPSIFLGGTQRARWIVTACYSTFSQWHRATWNNWEMRCNKMPSL
jgi:hypothetical protein